MPNTFPDVDVLFADNYELTVPATLHRVGGNVVIPVLFVRDNLDATIGDAQIITASPTLEARSTDITAADINLQVDINDVTFAADGTPTVGAALYSYYLIGPKPTTEGTTVWILSEELP